MRLKGFLTKDRDLKLRHEFSDLTTFTLDDESTKDVDDAVAIDPNPTKSIVFFFFFLQRRAVFV